MGCSYWGGGLKVIPKRSLRLRPPQLLGYPELVDHARFRSEGRSLGGSGGLGNKVKYTYYVQVTLQAGPPTSS